MPVIAHITTVSQNVPLALTKACLTGFFVFAAATPLFRYEEDERQEANERMLRLYYKDKGYCMDIIMPNTDFDTWLEAFDMDQYEDLCLALVHGDVTVSMPTFKMTKHYDLKPVMQKLGMEKVFTSGADLSGLTEENRLCLGVLQQDTYIEVDESGTKAASDFYT